ncbi:hypothetical protein PUN4_210030 [Paraburkholderia unamae]|nr:hypothetical protein PUN4_210030 [Paraburkholderia unamae]
MIAAARSCAGAAGAATGCQIVIAWTLLPEPYCLYLDSSGAHAKRHGVRSNHRTANRLRGYAGRAAFSSPAPFQAPVAKTGSSAR